MEELRSYKVGLREIINRGNYYFKIQESGAIENDFEKYAELYKRGITELANLLGRYDV